MEKLNRIPELKHAFYIRGKYIKYIQTSRKDHLERFPGVFIKEEQPRLEDIYLFYERQSAFKSEGQNETAD